MALFQSNNDDYTHRKIIISVYIVLKLSSSPWKILIKLKIEHENSKKILENNRIGTRNKSPLQKVSGIKVLSKFLNFSKLLQSKQNNFSSIFPDSCGNLWTISLFRNPVKWFTINLVSNYLVWMENPLLKITVHCEIYWLGIDWQRIKFDKYFITNFPRF